MGLSPSAARAGRVADVGTPDAHSLSRLVAHGKFYPLAGVNSYDIYLNDIKLGRATINVKRQGEEFVLQVVGKVRSFINNLFTMKYRGHAVISPSVQPSEAMIEERKGSKTKTYLMKFIEPNRAVTVQIEEKPGKIPKRAQQEFVSESLVLDPFSAVFFIRSREWRLGEEQVFDVLTGKKQYELRLGCKGETKLRVDGELREAWEIVLESRSVEDPRKIKVSGIVYLSKDSQREIIKVAGKHKIGKIKANMRRSEGAEEL